MNNKEAFLRRSWEPCKFVSAQGEIVTVLLRDGYEEDLPYRLVRERRPSCADCKRRLTRGITSYQSQDGMSRCRHCYVGLSARDKELLFGGPQWLSWEGQIAVRDMEDSHLVATLGMLRKRADEAAEYVGGSPEEHLGLDFQDLIEELRRRKPPQEQVQLNSWLLYVWTVLYTVLGMRGSK